MHIPDLHTAACSSYVTKDILVTTNTQKPVVRRQNLLSGFLSYPSVYPRVTTTIFSVVITLDSCWEWPIVIPAPCGQKNTSKHVKITKNFDQSGVLMLGCILCWSVECWCSFSQHDSLAQDILKLHLSHLKNCHMQEHFPDKLTKRTCVTFANYGFIKRTVGAWKQVTSTNLIGQGDPLNIQCWKENVILGISMRPFIISWGWSLSVRTNYGRLIRSFDCRRILVPWMHDEAEEAADVFGQTSQEDPEVWWLKHEMGFLSTLCVRSIRSLATDFSQSVQAFSRRLNFCSPTSVLAKITVVSACVFFFFLAEPLPASLRWGSDSFVASSSIKQRKRLHLLDAFQWLLNQIKTVTCTALLWSAQFQSGITEWCKKYVTGGILHLPFLCACCFAFYRQSTSLESAVICENAGVVELCFWDLQLPKKVWVRQKKGPGKCRQSIRDSFTSLEVRWVLILVYRTRLVSDLRAKTWGLQRHQNAKGRSSTPEPSLSLHVDAPSTLTWERDFHWIKRLVIWDNE